MFRKYEQCCFIKIQVACGWNAPQCHKGLHRACCKYALSYWIAARWVCAFWGGRESGKLKLGAGWPLHSSGWGSCHTCEEVTGYDPMVDMCQTVRWDWNRIAHHPQNLDTKSENAEYLCTKGTKWSHRGTPVTIYRNCQIASQSLRTWTWIISSPDPDDRQETGLFMWTWTEEIIDWCHQDSPCPQKCRRWRGSDKSHDQRSLQLWEHALCVCWLSWHYSKYSLLQKILRTSFVSCTAL